MSADDSRDRSKQDHHQPKPQPIHVKGSETSQAGGSDQKQWTTQRRGKGEKRRSHHVKRVAAAQNMQTKTAVKGGKINPNNKEESGHVKCVETQGDQK